MYENAQIHRQSLLKQRTNKLKLNQVSVKADTMLLLLMMMMIIIIIIIIILSSLFDYEDKTVLWNREILTDRGVTAKKPEIVIKNKNKTGNLHTDRRGSTNGQAYYEKGSRKKKLKCKSPCIEIQRMWNMKCVMIRVNTGKT